MITTEEATLGTQHKSILYSANCAQSFQSGVQPLVFKVKSSLARELKILVSVVRFRPGPPRNTKTTFGWFFIWPRVSQVIILADISILDLNDIEDS